MAHPRLLTIAQPVLTATAAFSPTQIAGLALWLKADTGLFKDASKADPCTADGDIVWTWADQSGNGRDAVQATAAARPTYKVNIQNGKPVVRFDGTDDSLAGTQVAGAAKTVFIVAKKQSAVGAAQILYNLSTTRYEAAYCAASLSPTAYYWVPNQAGGDALLGGTATNCTVLVVKFATVSSVTPYVNGSAGTPFDPDDTYAAETGLALAANHLGTQSGDFDISEYLIYDTALSDANRASVETYLNGRWAAY